MTLSGAAFACNFVQATGNCNSNAGEYFGGDFNTYVGYNGAQQTGNGWPSGLIQNFWNHCNQFSCDGQPVRLGLVGNCTVWGRVTGSYCGWNDRNNFINEARATQGGNAGSWSGGSWSMPSNLWLRNYQDTSWMNMRFATICPTGTGGTGTGGGGPSGCGAVGIPNAFNCPFLFLN